MMNFHSDLEMTNIERYSVIFYIFFFFRFLENVMDLLNYGYCDGLRLKQSNEKKIHLFMSHYTCQMLRKGNHFKLRLINVLVE